MLPPQRSARRARPRRTRAFLAGREELEIRVVPAVVGPEPTMAMAIAPASELIEGGSAPIAPDSGNGSPIGYTPQQIQAAYGINDIAFGSITGNGAGQTIAIVDAYDDPGFVDSTSPGFSTSDLAEFDQAFGLPNPPSFEKLNQFGSTTDLPGTDPAGAGTANWEYEEAMDVEWAHAIAPAANIILVEADSNTSTDLYDAVAMAADLPGVSTVSMSWGSPEFDGETGLDPFFETPSGHQGVTFVAATGDGGAPGTYPAYSPNVVAAGGTALTLSSDGTYGSEVGWNGSGGGVSSYETEPSYQDGAQSTGYRTIPDVSFNADFSTGVAVYDSYDNTGGGPWNEMGGTSLASPSWAALIAIADQGRVAMGGTTLDGASQTLPALYSLPSADFHDITSGNNGNSAGPGYDEVTGIGTPVANLLVPALASYGLSDQLVVTSPSAGTETAGSSFGLTVAVENAGGQLQTGASGTVTLSLANDPGGASLNGTLTATLDDGVATFSGLSIDGAGTGYSLLVTDGGLDSVTSSAFNVVPAAPAQLVIADQPPTSVTAGAGFGLTVDVEDAFGNLETGFGGSVTLSLGTDPTGGSLGGDVTATASGGVADFSGLTIDDAGTGYTIQATGSGLSTATTASFDVTSSTGDQLVVSSEPPQSVMAGAGFGLAVLVEDAYGNLETGYDGDVSVALTGGPTGASLGGTLTISVTDGVADFSGLTLDQAGSGYALDVTSSGLVAATTTTFAVTPAAPAQLAIADQPPSSVTAGAGFGLAVSVEDAYGNAEPSYSGNVTIALAGGSGLNGTLSVPATDGVAEFSGLTIDQAGSGYSLKATSNGLSAATSAAFVVTPAAPAQLAISSQPPSSITAGAGFGLAITVEDTYGNAEPSYSSNVMVAVAGGTGLDGTLSVPAPNGVAEFSGLTLDQAGAGYTLKATSNGLTAATTAAFAVTPAAPAQLAITTQPPSSVTAGAGFGLAVAAEDAYGNAEPGYSGNVTIALTGGTGLDGTLTVPASGGVADFSGLSIDQAGSSYTIHAGASGLSGATTAAFAVTPAAPAQLAIATQPPSSVTAGAGFGVVVSAEDAYGNAEPGYSGNVTIALSGGTGLDGTLSIPASNGVADFSGLTLDQAGAGYTLKATSNGLTAATTAAFAVTPAAPAQLVITSQPPSSVTAGAGFGLAVSVEDTYGNAEPSYSSNVVMVAVAGGAGLDGTLSVPAPNGVAEFSGLTLDQAGSGYTLKVTSNGLAAATTTTFAVTPAAPAQLAIAAQPPSSVTAGAGFGLAVSVEDAYGNPESNYSGNVTVALASGSGLNGTLTVSSTDGVADFSGLSLDQAGAGYLLKVTSNGLAAATTTTFTVTPAAPAQLAITSQPPSSVTAGADFGLVVSVEDTYGNVEPNYGGDVSVAIAGGTGLDGTLSVPAFDGVADFAGLTLDQAGTGYTLEVTSNGLSAATSSFAVTAAAPAQLAISTQPPSSVTAGAGFGLAVAVEDAFGNAEPSYSGNVTVALTGGANLGGTITVPASGGTADFSGLTLDQAGAGYLLTVTSNGLSGATTTAFAVTPAAPAQLVISSQPPSSITAGAGAGLAVSVEDSYGNAEPGYSGNVTVALTGGTGLDGTLTVPASGGVADFSGLSLDQAGSGYAIQAGAAGLTGATTNPFAVTPAAPARLVITSQPPSSITAGVGFGLSVAVEDAFGNAEPSFNGNVSVALAGGSSGPGLGGTLTIPASAGVASFSGLTLDRAGSGDTIQVSGIGLTAASTTAFQITPAAASQLVTIAQPPAGLAAGQTFGFTVAAEDPFGNVVTGFGGTVTASMAGDPSGDPLSGTLTVTANQGLASFSGLTIDQSGAGYALQATAGNLSSAVTGPVSVTPAVATRLVVTAQPPVGVTAGSGFGLTVAAEDAFGNVVTSFQGKVTASLAGGALGGVTTVTAVDGVAQFSGLMLDKAAAGDTLQLTSGGLSSATTNPFAVNPAAPARWVFISQPPGKLPARKTFQVVAALEDAFGNVVTDDNGNASVSLAGAPRDSMLHGTLTVPVNAGIAVFDGSLSKKLGDGYALSVTGDGLAPATSDAFKVTHPDPARSVFSAAFRHGRIRVPASQRHSHRGR